MMRLIVSRSTKRTDVQANLADPAGADAARWDRLTGRRGHSAPRTSSIISNRPGVLVLSTLVVVALSALLILSSADVSRRSGGLSLHDDVYGSNLNDEPKKGLGAEIKHLVLEGEKEVAAVAHKILHPKLPTREDVEKYRGERRREFEPDLQQVGYFPPGKRVEADGLYDNLQIPRDEHLGAGPMIRDWKFVSFHALLAGAIMHGTAGAAIDPPNDSEKLDNIQKQLKGLSIWADGVAKAMVDLGGIKKELKADLEFMNTQVTEIGRIQSSNQSSNRKDLADLREDLLKLSREVESLRTQQALQAQTNASRQSLYNPSTAPAVPSSTAQVEMINTYASEVAFVVNRRTYYVAPGGSRTSDPIPAGTFTYEVVGIQPPTLRTVEPNKIFTVRVYMR